MRVKTGKRTKPSNVRSTVRPRPTGNPELEPPNHPKNVVVDDAVHMYRLDGVGDMMFMEPAVRKLKALMGNTKLILHTRGRYQEMWPLIGFDGGGVEESKVGGYGGESINLNWALENHAASRVLDRVSQWEDILHIQIGEEKVKMSPGKHGAAMLKDHANYDPTKPSLYYEPFSVYADRSLFPDMAREIFPVLLSRFNVVMLASTWTIPNIPTIDWEHGEFVVQKIAAQKYCWPRACGFVGTNITDWFAIAGACDAALCMDTGALYVAASSGVPSVGMFNHVDPWLRTQRFDNVRAISFKQKGCTCDHHGPCTRERQFCRGYIPADYLLDHVDAALAEEYGYVHVSGHAMQRPCVRIAIVDPDDDRGAVRRTEFSIIEAARGLRYETTVVEAKPPDDAGFTIEVVAGDGVERGNVWHEFAQVV